MLPILPSLRAARHGGRASGDDQPWSLGVPEHHPVAARAQRAADARPPCADVRRAPVDLRRAGPRHRRCRGPSASSSDWSAATGWTPSATTPMPTRCSSSAAWPTGSARRRRRPLPGQRDDLKRLHDSARDLLGGADLRERDEARTIREIPLDPPPISRASRVLPTPPGPVSVEQPNALVPHPRAYRVDLTVAANRPIKRDPRLARRQQPFDLLRDRADLGGERDATVTLTASTSAAAGPRAARSCDSAVPTLTCALFSRTSGHSRPASSLRPCTPRSSAGARTHRRVAAAGNDLLGRTRPAC